MKGAGMLVVSLRDIKFGFWFPLGCSGKNAIIFCHQGPRLELHVKNYKNKYIFNSFYLLF